MEGRPSVHHPLSSYIENSKEKNGMIKTKLKIPYWNRQEPQPPVDLSDEDICIIGSTTVGLTNGLNDTRGTADGGFTEITTPGTHLDTYLYVTLIRQLRLLACFVLVSSCQL